MPSKFTATLTLPDGTRKYYYGKTKKEAKAKRDADALLLSRGTDIANNTTFKQFAETWFRLYKKDQVHIRTEQTILGILNCYVYPQIGDRRLKDIKAMHIQAMMRTVSKRSNSTQKKVLEYTKAIFNAAVDSNIIVKSPVTSNIKAGGKKADEKTPLTKEQTKMLLSSLEGTRAYLLVLVLLKTGLRIGEALGLMWTDIDWENHTLNVQRSIVYPCGQKQGVINTDLKTRNARRIIPIQSELYPVLLEAKTKTNSLYVFSMQNGNYLSESSFRALWKIIDYRTIGKKDRKAKGKTTLVDRTLDFKVTPHLLRHTCITNWFELGLDIKEVQRLAGHADAEITLNTYTHYMETERFAETARKIG